MPIRAVFILAGLVVLASAACGGNSSPTSPIPPGGGAPSVPDVTEVLVGAGDIGQCGSKGPSLTAQLLDGIQGAIFTAGDNVQMDGTMQEFTNCFHPFWGRHFSRILPSPGNHDYGITAAEPYFAYFGASAGPPGLGYYSYDLGAWHVVALNSNIPAGAGSAQEQWLRLDLADNPSRCTIAYWHHPLFCSGGEGSDSRMRAIWRALYEFKADVVINGHNHFYERFAPQDPTGRSDFLRGIRQFTVGTGGATLYGFGPSIPNLEVRDNTSWGVLKLTLSPTMYDWQFVPVAGHSFRDQGSGRCVE